MTYTLIPNIWYTITPETDCDVATPNGISIHLPAGIQYFHFADCVSIDITGTATVTQNPPLFKPASASALGGGCIESNLNVGHGAAAAVAAQCVLTQGDLAAGGTLADSNGQSVELEAPHKYAEGYLAFRDATEACTLAIGEWSKTWEEKRDAKASGTFPVMGDEGTISVSGIEVPIPGDPADETAWNAAFAAAECGIVCTAAEAHGEVDVSVEAAEVGETGNSIVISVGSYEPVTLAGGSTARTKQDVVDAIASDADCPVHASLDADEAAISLTAKEYGSNDTISVDGDMFANWSGMSGGHGDYTVAELVTAISGEFDDITPTAGETEGAITLTAAVAGADANSIEYTATGCFGSGTVKQGSTTRGKNAVTQTAFKIYLNGEELDVEPAPTPELLEEDTAMKNHGVYTVAAAGTALNYSAVTTGVNATARIWLDYNDTTDVTWPPEWVWLTEDGLQPDFDFFKRFKLEIENDTVATTAKLVDSYATAPEYAYTPLTSNDNIPGAPLNLLSEYTSSIGSPSGQKYYAYTPNKEGYWAYGKTGDDKYGTACELSRAVALKAWLALMAVHHGSGITVHIEGFDDEAGVWKVASAGVTVANKASDGHVPYLIKTNVELSSTKWRLVASSATLQLYGTRLFEI